MYFVEKLTMFNSPEALLDDMLHYFSFSLNGRPWATLNEATRDYHNRHNVGQPTTFLGNLRELTISKVVDKLKKDKYIMVRGIIADTNEIQYTVTFEGLLFLNRGGYVGESKRQSLKDFNLKIRNLILAAGSLIGGLYSLWKLYSHFDLLISINLLTFLCLFLFGIIAGIIIHLIAIDLWKLRK